MKCHQSQCATSNIVQVFLFFYVTNNRRVVTLGAYWATVYTRRVSMLFFRYSHSSKYFNEEIMEVCDEKGGVDARLIHASVTALALWWASFQTPQESDRPNHDFSPWGAGFCTKLLTLLSFGTTQTCPLVPVAYPPSAVMAGVSTKLGPVVRLDCG